MMNDLVLLVGKRDAARALGISVRSLENLISAKRLSIRKIGRRTLIPRRALEQFCRRDHATEPPASDTGLENAKASL